MDHTPSRLFKTILSNIKDDPEIINTIVFQGFSYVAPSLLDDVHNQPCIVTSNNACGSLLSSSYNRRSRGFSPRNAESHFRPLSNFHNQR